MPFSLRERITSLPASSGPIRLEGEIDLSLRCALHEFIKAFPERFSRSGETGVAFRQRPRSTPEEGLEITPLPGGGVEIAYAEPREAWRGLGIIMGQLQRGSTLQSYREETRLDTLGMMLDASRNGVPRVASVRKLIRHCALMGINMLMLYTEDTYEIPGEPQFGYGRGGYTQEELAEIDAYAAYFNIEVVPCIQTLGHLEQILQWPEYQPLKDTNGVLLAGDTAVEALVEKMIHAASQPFRSTRIHIGMDEAHGIGSGQYRFRNGYKPPFEILTSHLERVAAICRRKGLQPMIWGDMFFRLGSKTNQYYDIESAIPEEAARSIAPEVQLVYWDYYHTDTAFYDDWIARHRAMGKEPIFAAGIWSWSRFWTSLPHSLATIRAGMSAAHRNGLKEAFVAAWGDDGMECDLFSTLPAIQFFCEMAYNPEKADAALDAHFAGSTGATLAPWLAASRLDNTPDITDPALSHANPSKWVLWHDPLLSFLERHIPESYPAHYEALAKEFAPYLKEPETDSPILKEDRRLHLVALLARVLAAKTAFHRALRPAYLARDRERVRQLAEEALPSLRSGVEALRKAHRTLWHLNYKPFGWEVLDGRYGALLARLETTRDRLLDWLAAPEGATIEELELEPHDVLGKVPLEERIFRYATTHSPSWLY